MLFFYYYYYYTGSTVHTLVFTLLKVSGEHQTTGMVIHYCNELAVNHMNYQYVISEAQDKVNTICRLSSVVVVGTNVDDDLYTYHTCGIVLIVLVGVASRF